MNEFTGLVYCVTLYRSATFYDCTLIAFAALVATQILLV